MKLSIIIPYYNTYAFTVELLTELEKQLCYSTDVEVILIDDGCNETRLDKFSFLTITHLDKNYGASHAWNVGLEQATGEYIAFIDSDDMIASSYLPTILYAIEKEQADEIVFDFWIRPYNKLRRKPTCRAIWKAVYKRWLVPKFDETLKYNTDKPFKWHMNRTKHTKAFINIPLYYYNSVREGSITWKKNKGLFKEEK